MRHYVIGALVGLLMIGPWFYSVRYDPIEPPVRPNNTQYHPHGSITHPDPRSR